jgi:hypothetical protein
MKRSKTAEAIKAAGGLPRVFARIADGETLASLAREFGCSRQYLTKLLERPAHAERFAAAKREAAGALEEKAQETIELAPVERDSLRKAELQAGIYKWRAGLASPATHGDKAPQHTTNVLSLGELHLKAVSDPELIRQAREAFEKRTGLQVGAPRPPALPAGEVVTDKQARREETLAKVVALKEHLAAELAEQPDAEVKKRLDELERMERQLREQSA